MKQLSSYPRPKDDTGIGLHLSANAWDARYYGKDASRDFDEWRACGVKWLKVCAGGDSQLAPVTEFVKAGFEVIVRLYADKPHPTYVPAADLMRRYADVGVHYIEGGNEPELNVEWWLGANPANAHVLLARQYRNFADEAARAGVIPVTYAIEGDRCMTVFKAFLLEMQRMKWLDAIEGSVIGIHNRPGRMPIFSPPIDATHGGVGFVFRSYEAWIPLITSILGWCPPLLGTEAGREPSEVDGDLLKHAADNVAIAVAPWLPELFCQCFWLWPPGGMGNSTAWRDNATYGAKLPVIKFLAEAKKVIRNGDVVEPPPGPAIPAAELVGAVRDKLATFPWGKKEANRRGYLPWGDEVATTVDGVRWYCQPVRKSDGSLALLAFKAGSYTSGETVEIPFTL